MPIGTPATGGSCPCAKSKCPAPWCSTILAEPAASSKPSWPTTSASVDPTRWRRSSPARSAGPATIGSALFERIHQPYIREGQRTGALRFGDPRAMALTGALVVFVHAVAGFTNKSLRGLVAGLLGQDYTRSQMTYDLRRLRLHGLIQRVPHTNTYTLTPEGVRVAVFYNKIHDRVLRPLMAADRPPAPPEVRRALAT